MTVSNENSVVRQPVAWKGRTIELRPLEDLRPLVDAVAPPRPPGAKLGSFGNFNVRCLFARLNANSVRRYVSGRGAGVKAPAPPPVMASLALALPRSHPGSARAGG